MYIHSQSFFSDIPPVCVYCVMHSTPPKPVISVKSFNHENFEEGLLHKFTPFFPPTLAHKLCWKLQSYVRTSSVYVIFHCTIPGCQNTSEGSQQESHCLRTRELTYYRLPQWWNTALLNFKILFIVCAAQ
jgi:hypothetical protein